MGERQRDRETERQRDRETERQRDRETERQRDRETEKQRDRETERVREREREREEWVGDKLGRRGKKNKVVGRAAWRWMIDKSTHVKMAQLLYHQMHEQESITISITPC